MVQRVSAILTQTSVVLYLFVMLYNCVYVLWYPEFWLYWKCILLFAMCCTASRYLEFFCVEPKLHAGCLCAPPCCTKFRILCKEPKHHSDFQIGGLYIARIIFTKLIVISIIVWLINVCLMSSGKYFR